MSRPSGAATAGNGSGRPAWLEIDLGALRRNIEAVRRRTGTGVRFLAVVKANAYGHGLLPVARAAIDAGADMLGVALLDEALALRSGGVTAPVLILGSPLPDAAPETVAAGVSQVVSSPDSVDALSRAAREWNREAGVHLKVDTGMGRVGVDPPEAVELARRILAAPGLRLDGVCTHFATSDEEPGYLAFQNAVFAKVLDEMDREGIPTGLRHCANSGAVQSLPETHRDMVRPGLLLYGCPPLPLGPDLQPVLRWKARLTQVRPFRAGTPVGYGLTARLSRDSRLAILPVGYADGWPRSLSNRGAALVRGKRAPVVGRVSMDQCLLDVTGIPEARAGDEAVLIGVQDGRAQTADDVARMAATNTHDILAGLSARLPRVVTGH